MTPENSKACAAAVAQRSTYAGFHPAVQNQLKECVANIGSISVDNYCRTCDTALRTDERLTGEIEQCRTINQFQRVLRSVISCKDEVLKMQITLTLSVNPSVVTEERFFAEPTSEVGESIKGIVETTLRTLSDVKILRVNMISGSSGVMLAKIELSTPSSKVPDVIVSIQNSVDSGTNVFPYGMTIVQSENAITFQLKSQADDEGTFSASEGVRFGLILLGCLGGGALCTLAGVMVWRRIVRGGGSSLLHKMDVQITSGASASSSKYETVAASDVEMSPMTSKDPSVEVI